MYPDSQTMVLTAMREWQAAGNKQSYCRQNFLSHPTMTMIQVSSGQVRSGQVRSPLIVSYLSES